MSVLHLPSTDYHSATMLRHSQVLATLLLSKVVFLRLIGSPCLCCCQTSADRLVAVVASGRRHIGISSPAHAMTIHRRYHRLSVWPQALAADLTESHRLKGCDGSEALVVMHWGREIKQPMTVWGPLLSATCVPSTQLLSFGLYTVYIHHTV